MMVIIRAEAINRTSEIPGIYKIAAAPDTVRHNEPWQWRINLLKGQAAAGKIDGQVLTFGAQDGAGDNALELQLDDEFVAAQMEPLAFSEDTQIIRDQGEIVAVYVTSGQLEFGGHPLRGGDVAIFSGGEHFEVEAKPNEGVAEVGLVRLTSTNEAGLVWIP